MTMFDQLQQQGARLFLDEVAQRPQGRYVHYILVRESESFPVFQTDGTLNVIRTQAGVGTNGAANAGAVISRLVMFKRKQTSPERLAGRELLRLHGIITDQGDRECVYNGEKFCKRCPDCITYGYAIGDQGAEKSKVLVDSAFSITRYEDSHHAFHFNALYEHGTMTDEGKTRSSFGEQDHIVPQVFFPAVVTLRDPTYESFLYVFGNILRTARYGAQETRTGRVENHVVGIAFTSGEIFSNLRFSQSLYDALAQEGQLATLPLDRQQVVAAASRVARALLAAEPVEQPFVVLGDEVTPLLSDVRTLYQDSTRTRVLLQSLDGKTRAYAEHHLGGGRRRA
jgi:CRISPR-associated protein Csc2